MARPSERWTIVKPVGTPLFRYDLRSWLEQRFKDEADRVARDLFAKPDPVPRLAFRSAVRKVVWVEALQIMEITAVRVEQCRSIAFASQMGLSMTFSGAPQLWQCATRGMQKNRPVRGLVLGNVLSLGAAYNAGNEIVAQGALASELDLVREHARAQAAVIKDYTLHLPKNVLTYVAESWDLHQTKRSFYGDQAIREAHYDLLRAIVEGRESASTHEDFFSDSLE
uniref:hypothetical protein n=1 Tax=uncultured Sphingomonas sp. TaxID=158754 RepID=UPI0035CA5876